MIRTTTKVLLKLSIPKLKLNKISNHKEDQQQLQPVQSVTTKKETKMMKRTGRKKKMTTRRATSHRHNRWSK